MALILTRRAGESVKIGESVVMTVREVHPAKIYVSMERAGIQQAEWIRIYSSAKFADPEIEIGVTGINRTQVRLAFEADKSVKIVRTELLK